MEEKNQAKQVEQKYTYDELNKIASNLFQQNRELEKRVKVMSEAIGDLQTQNLFAYVGMLNKVLDNSIHFKPEFIDEVTGDLVILRRMIRPMIIGGGVEPDSNNSNGEGQDGAKPSEQA